MSTRCSRRSNRLGSFGVEFDVYFHEQSMYESGAVEQPSSRLPRRGPPTKRTGRCGSTTEKYGDEKDRVLVRSNGDPPPTSPGDCAYYLDKRERGFDLCVIMLGG